MRISDWSSDVCSSDLLPPGETDACHMARPVNGIGHGETISVEIVDPAFRIIVQPHRGVGDPLDIHMMGQREIVEPQLGRDAGDGLAQVVGSLGLLDRTAKPFGHHQHAHRASSRSQAAPQVAGIPTIDLSSALRHAGSSRRCSAGETRYPYYSTEFKTIGLRTGLSCAAGIYS